MAAIIDMFPLFVVICRYVEKVQLLKRVTSENQNYRTGANAVFEQHLGADVLYFKAVGTRNDRPDRSTTVLDCIVHCR